MNMMTAKILEHITNSLKETGTIFDFWSFNHEFGSQTHHTAQKKGSLTHTSSTPYLLEPSPNGYHHPSMQQLHQHVYKHLVFLPKQPPTLPRPPHIPTQLCRLQPMTKASRSDEYAWLQKFLSIFPTPWKKQAPFLTSEVLTMNVAHKPITQPRKKGPSYTHCQHHIFLNLHITAITIHPCNNSTNTYTGISSSSQNNHRHYQDLPTYPLNSVGCSPWPINNNNNNNNLRERTFL